MIPRKDGKMGKISQSQGEGVLRDKQKQGVMWLLEVA
jgi:hypothetical protein